jgi:hypothetical protein
MLWTAVTAVVAAGLFWCFLAEARTYPVNADGSGAALQGWDMLHGNLLLSGWWTADVSFYTFETPLDALVEAVRGLNPDITHVTAAIAYTALVVIAALLARGAARGPEGAARAAVTAAILLVAPGHTQSTGLLLGSPDHIGVCVPILLAYLLIDRVRPGGIRGAGGIRGDGSPRADRKAPRAERKKRWWVPVTLCVLLVWAQLDDPTAEFAAAFAIAAVCLVRAVLPAATRRGRGSRETQNRSPRGDIALGLAAVVSYVLTELAIGAIRAAGGYSMRSLSAITTGVPPARWGAQLVNTGHNVLVLFGADFFEQPTTLTTLVAVARLVGVVLAAGGLLAGAVSLLRRGDRVTQAVAVGALVTLGAGAFLTPMSPGYDAHEIAVVLPFTAVLAGRTVAPALLRRRLLGLTLPRLTLLALLGAVGACYLVILGYNASQPGIPARAQSLAEGLTARHLTSGLGPYWAGNAVTVASGGRTRIAPMGFLRGPYPWITKPAWYDPDRNYANFVIAGTDPANGMSFMVADVLRAYGKPAREYRFGQYVIMVYDRNLLRQVDKPVQPSPDTGLRL